MCQGGGVLRQEIQRLIIDARRANALLGQPPPVRLCTPEAFSKFEFNYGPDDLDKALTGIVGDSSALFAGLSDIKDAFHRLRQPRWMQELFCLDPHTGVLRVNTRAGD